MTRDVLWALRWLRNNPLFTVAVIAILALGIGANTAVFSIVDAVLLRPLPYKSSERLVKIEATSSKVPSGAISSQDYLRWSSRKDLFEKTVAHIKDIVTVTGISQPDQVVAVRTSAGLFSMLGAHASMGRALMDSDNNFNAPNTVVLSDRAWRRLFRADPDVVGRSVTISNAIYTIVGVMPPEFDFPYSNVEIWMPLHLTPVSSGMLQVVALTKKGLSLPQVQGAMEIVARQLEREEPQQRAGLRIVVSAWRETPGREYELTLVFILVAVALVLLIACADVGGLLLSRAVQRQREIAIRASLGAGFWRVMRQLLAESLVLAVLGSAAGLAVAHYALQYLLKQITTLPIVLPHVQRVALNERVLIFNAGLCLLLACLFSVAPVFMARKTDLQAVMRSGSTAGGSRRSARLFSALIACEAAFAFLLLVGSGLMVRSLIRLQEADHGFRPEHVLTMRVPIGSRTQPRPSGKYETKPQQIAYYHDLIERLERVPGVDAAAIVNNLPLSGANTSLMQRGPNGEFLPNSARTISPGYFSAMGIPLIAGRFFSESDHSDAPRVVIINEALARHLFPNRDAVGRTLPPEGSGPVATIVGVVKDASQMSYEQAPIGEIYLPYRQVIFGVFMSTIVVRTSGEPLSLADTLRREVWALDPDQPIVKVQTMDEVIADSIWRPRFSAWIFSVLGGLALLLTSAGVYGVVAYTTALRAKEVGIRIALGATPWRVVAAILRDAMIPLGIGIAISVIAALLLSRLLTSLLYEISTADPATYLAAGALLLVIAAFASARPAWRAAVGDPLEALRAE